MYQSAGRGTNLRAFVVESQRGTRYHGAIAKDSARGTCMRPRVTIIVPAWNAEDTMDACLAACLEQSYAPVEVIVVDDGSTDATAAAAERRGVRCIRQDNAGPAAARNRGAKEGDGEVLAFTDSDCVPRRDWLEKLMAAMDNGAAAVGGAYAIANEHAWLAVFVQEEIALRHEGFRQGTDFLGSFNFAVRRAAFEQVGGFDESFTQASGEDNDLAYRLHDIGAAFAYAPGAVVAHHHPERLGPYLRTQARHGYWRVHLYAKHPRRARGDRYAGPADMVAPVLVAGAAVTLAVGPIGLAMGFPPLVAAVCGVAAAADVFALAALRLPWAQRVAERAPMLGTYRCLGVIMLRDAARAAGMVRGIAAMLLRAKGRP